MEPLHSTIVIPFHVFPTYLWDMIETFKRHIDFNKVLMVLRFYQIKILVIQIYYIRSKTKNFFVHIGKEVHFCVDLRR